jgi:hypothetical protein
LEEKIMNKLNCWEFKKCGRQPNGPRAADLGECPVPTFREYHGVHDGRCAGRACWAVPASLCAGRQQGVFVQKLKNCQKCDFFNAVKKEEEGSRYGFTQTPPGMRIYMRNRNLHAGVETSTTNGNSISADIVGEVERKYIFFAGYAGKNVVEMIFVEIGYRRGTPMAEGQFDYFLRLMMISLPDEERTKFQEAIKSVGPQMA